MSYPPQDPYQQQDYYQPAYPQPRGKSIASLVLGLVSLVFGFTFVLPIIGVILGAIGMAKEPAGCGMAIAGVILNLICLAGWIALIIILALLGITIWASTAVTLF
ncbi:DUF4190 domain-containing protein [Galactobacter sp.]|uniref:DUF4190 domain-containing protein n=1 Tax=Galactobacter sp. TaxID=2676125 RepID=UPI0025B86E47|nr:DUF4190 domain-containing protein [Galactobacter sp.]